jgi:hypothetical protein
VLKSSDISKLISAPPSGLTAGSLAFLTQREQNAPDRTTKQLAFLADATALHPRTAGQATPPYQHPGVRPADPRRGGGPLTPVEMAWLNRLPADPATTSFTDAETLAALIKDVSPTKHPIDAKLVASHWYPVRDVHDENSARRDIANTRALVLPPVPASALPAAGEAIAAEQPALSPSEALHRGSQLVDAAAEQRAATKQSLIDNAQRTLDRLATARAERISPLRMPLGATA